MVVVTVNFSGNAGGGEFSFSLGQDDFSPALEFIEGGYIADGAVQTLVVIMLDEAGYDAAGVFTLDCLIGNTDRHQDNWGLVVENGKVNPLENLRLSFSPAFDNGTALGYEIREEDIDKYHDPERLRKYLSDARHTRHHMKWSLEQENPCNFYEFLRQFVLAFPEAGPIITLQKVGFTHGQLVELLKPLVNAVSDPTYALTRRRLDFVLQLIMKRKELLEEALEL